MASREELYTALRNADAAGDTASAQRLAAYIKTMPGEKSASEKQADQAASDRELYAPTNGMGMGEKLVAGYGKAAADLVRGARQVQGYFSPVADLQNKISGLQGEIDESKRLDAPLLKDTAGLSGNIAGNIVNMIPSVFAPGSSTIPGAALMGSLSGALTPTASDDSRTQNMVIGAGAGVAGTLAGRGLNALRQGGKALVAPFTEKGRNEIAGRVLERFADDPAKLATVTSAPTITGARPTIAEQTGDAGLARLQDSLRAVDPQINNQISGRLAENNAARVNALQGLAGTTTSRNAAITARGAATEPLYDAAFAKTVEVDAGLKELLGRPSVQKALGRAAALAKEDGGRVFGLTQPKEVPASAILDASGNSMRPATTVPATISGQTLQDLKMGMDALLKDPTSGIAGEEARVVKATRDSIVRWMESAIPEFNAARTGYAAASKPINAMDVGGEVARRATSNTSDLAGNPRMQANALLGMLRDEPGLVERATGRKGLGDLSNVMDSKQLNLLRSVAGESDRAAAVATAGNGPGSATAQRMASQNVLRQVIGPLGLPESWAENALANTVIGKPLNLIYGGVSEPKIQQALAQAVIDPDTARMVIQAARDQGVRLSPSTLSQLATQAAKAAGPAAALSMNR